MGSKPLILTDQQRNQICKMLSLGASRTAAAQYAGCHPATLRAEMRRNPQFAHRVTQSELDLEAVMLRAVREASSEIRQWRAAAWALERIFPNRYAKRRTHSLTLDQVHELVSEVSEIVASELPVPRFRQRIFDRLAVLMSVQVDSSRQAETENSHAATDPPNESQRLDGPPLQCEGGDGRDQAETPSEPPSESPETPAGSE